MPSFTGRELREIVAIGSDYDPVCAVGHLTECAREVRALRRALRRIRNGMEYDTWHGPWIRAVIDRALERRARKGSK